jgi:predicted site-specific integrase-resolvase
MEETLAEMPEGNDLIDRDAAAEILGIHPQTVMRYGREGKLTRYRIGPRINTRAILRFSKTEVETLRDQVIPA